MNDRDLDQHVAGCAAAHRRLLTHLDTMLGDGTLTDAVVTRPSRLPDWTVGHVLTHLARNADSHVRAIEGALRGETVDQYTGGAAGRSAEIESGARRAVQEQVNDLRAANAALEMAWERSRAGGWGGSWRSPALGERPVGELPFRRWREVEVHHADLGLAGFDFEDWSPRYVTEELSMRTMEWSSRHPMGLTALPVQALRLSPALRLAWLMGRVVPEGLDPVHFA